MAGASNSCRVAFLTLGCPKNEVDTDSMRARVAASAFSVVDDLDDADVVVVNTCSFIEAATEESVATVLEVISQWVPEAQNRKVVVAGCMPSRYGAELAESMPEVAAFVPVLDEGEIVSAIERATGISGSARVAGSAGRSLVGFSAYLKVSDGCHRACAYCTIPSIRGPYRSRALSEIVTEAEELVSLGAREIVLIGQDISAYGRDRADGVVLADVVRATAAIPGVSWLRLMYVQPDGITDELLSVMATHDNVVRYLDMPLQHASRSVLRAMRRSGDADVFMALLARIRAALPGVALRTTLIAGFPGETRQDVVELERFIEAAQFDYVGVFAYSPEEGTEAVELPNQVPMRTRRARAQRLRDRADALGFDRASARVGDTIEVLVEGVDEDEGFIVGRWRGQAPEIDGLVVLDRGEAGQVTQAVVVDSLGYDLEAEVR